MLTIILGILGAVVVVVGFVALFVWTRRSERDIEVPKRELTEQEQKTDLVERGFRNNFFSGGF